MVNTNIVTIDGPGAAGKGTLSKKLRDDLGFVMLDTGSLYRAITLYLREEYNDNLDSLTEEQIIQASDHLITTGHLFEYSLNPKIRENLTSKYVPNIARVQDVRNDLKAYQRDFGAFPPKLPNGDTPKGAIIEGRDIGTVICPHALCKLYITASVDTRAKRRFAEHQEKGDSVTYEEVLQDLKDRDEKDQNRPNSPLKPADDAYILDTSELSIDEVLEKAKLYIDSKLSL